MRGMSDTSALKGTTLLFGCRWDGIKLSLCMGEPASFIQSRDVWAESALDSLALKVLTSFSFASRRRLATSIRRFRLTVCTFIMTSQFALSFALLEMINFLGMETAVCTICTDLAADCSFSTLSASLCSGASLHRPNPAATILALSSNSSCTVRFSAKDNGAIFCPASIGC